MKKIIKPKSIRQIQRTIRNMINSNIIKPNVSFGRSQTYSIYSQKPSALSNFFLNKFWEELFEIREELLKEKSIKSLDDDPLIDTFNVFHKLRSLVKMMPKDIQDKINVEMEDFIELTEMDKKRIEARIGSNPILLLGGVPYSEEEWKRRQEKRLVISYILTEKLWNIISEVSKLLHEKLRMEVPNNEK